MRNSDNFGPAGAGVGAIFVPAIAAALRRPLTRPLLGTALCLGLLWAALNRAGPIDFAGIWQIVLAIPASNWAAAALLSGISFWAVGRYDAAIHKLLRTGYGSDQASSAGRCAIAIGQAAGFGLITGAFIRWVWGQGSVPALLAAKVTACVGACFLICASFWVLLLLPVTSVPYANLGPVAAMSLLCACIWASWSFSDWVPKGRLNHLPPIPPIRAQLRLLALTAVDLGCAALAFWELLPNPDLVSPLVLVVAFSIAVLLGLASNSPSGLGAFDMTLLLLLPMVPDAQLLASCIAFRIVYFALPAVLAGTAVMARILRPAPSPNLTPPAPTAHPDLSNANNAELRLAEAGGKGFITCSENSILAIAQLSQTKVGLFDPVGSIHPALTSLQAHAQHEDRSAALYKCTAKTALVARKFGWATLRIAQDAVLDPQRFDLGRPACRQLRRKLRKVDAQGLHVEHIPAGHPLPLHQIAQVDAQWAARHGTPRGFSMSRPSDAPLHRQQVFLIWRGLKLQGYCSFHQTDKAWAVDLMPQIPCAPDGAMHLAIYTAIEAARAIGIPRLSLAAVPAPIPRSKRLSGILHRAMCQRLSNPGLHQFKASFGPRWVPLYLVAPTPLGLVAAGVQITRAINAKPKHKTHDHYERNMFASDTAVMARRP